ncbi:MAG: energy-coupling factor transporter ATPase [Oscillospiraceae bacterium]|nr:energy-coupling factor transporter ATPase [Oscillospiraceae bacterium]
MKELIKLEGVRFSYGGADVLKNISLSVQEGEFVAVLGYNGCGKSTLAKLLNGILVPVEGRVLVDGMDTADEAQLEAIRRTVGMVFQNPDNQIVATIVEEDIAFAPENLGLEPSVILQRVDEAIEAVGLQKHRLDAPHKLSGGQKQRVAIAGVLAMQPRCIVLDEPTAMLDPVGRGLVMKVIKRLNKELGITVVLITHFMEEAAQADRVVVLSQGEVALQGTPSEVFSHAERMLELGLGVPPATELCLALKARGVDIATDIVLPEDCVKQLAKLLGGVS